MIDLDCAARRRDLPNRPLPFRGTCRAIDTRLRDRAGRVRTSATLPGARLGKPPGNAGKRYPATPPTPSEVLAILDQCPKAPYGRRDRALIVVLWRSGLRISEALSLHPSDLDPEKGVLNVRCGKGSKQRFAGMDPWAWDQLEPWLRERSRKYPPGPIFCVCEGPTKGGPIAPPYVRSKLKQLAAEAGIQKRIAPHQFRHAMAVELAGELPIHQVKTQLGHSSLATTANYLASIAPVETWSAMAARPAPQVAS